MMLGSFAYDSGLVLGSVYYPNGKRICTTHSRTGPTIYQMSRDTQRFNYDIPAAKQRYPGIAGRGNELTRAARDLCDCLLAGRCRDLLNTPGFGPVTRRARPCFLPLIYCNPRPSTPRRTCKCANCGAVSHEKKEKIT